MWSTNRSRYSDPFRLSPLGRLRVGVAWMRAPATVSRWLVSAFAVCALATSLGITVEIVMQAASPNLKMLHSQRLRESETSETSRYVPPPWDKSHAGPSSSRLVDVPGISDCRPLPSVKWPSHLDPFGEPMVLAIDKTGTVWGPSCIVSAGRTSS